MRDCVYWDYVRSIRKEEMMQMNLLTLCGVYGVGPKTMTRMLENGEVKSVIGMIGGVLIVDMEKLAKDLGETEEEAEKRATLAERLFGDGVWTALGEKWIRRCEK